MNADILKTDRLAIGNRDRQRFALRSIPRMNPDFSSNQSCYAQCTPNAWSPPARPLALNPIDRRC